MGGPEVRTGVGEGYASGASRREVEQTDALRPRWASPKLPPRRGPIAFAEALMTLYALKNDVKPYAWGSRTALTDLLGLPNPSGTPQAELWMGAHAKGSSRLRTDDSSLRDRILGDPARYLGRETSQRFGGKLPYLFKVLAASTPLSLQAHPSREQAREGFAREEAEGKALDDPTRNYQDENHKPELICALTPFWALSGFREGAEILALARGFGLEGLEALLQPFEPRLAQEPSSGKSSGAAQATLFRELFQLPEETRRRAIRSLRRGARGLLEEAGSEPSLAESQVYWAARFGLELAELYPDDPGVLAALMLNIVKLEPGEAIYLPAGQLHAYLDGVGLEIMASSDNVLRGGLTPKHVDVDELMSVLDFTPRRPEIQKGQVHGFPGGRQIDYPTPAPEFLLSCVELDEEAHHLGGTGPEIVLSLTGEIELWRGDTALSLARGDAAFCAADPEPYQIKGSGRLARAQVGEPSD